MFKSLRNKFTLIQVAIVSVVLIASFSFIFIYINKESVNDVEHELDRLSQQVKLNRISIIFNGNSKKELYYISIEDSLGQHIISNVNVDEDEFNEVIVSNKYHNNQVIEIDEEYWIIRRIVGSYETSTIFLNVTRQVELVHSLRKALIGVGLLVLAVMTLISRYFATQAIKPIEKTYKKQEEFVSDAAHELRTPLTIINTNTDVLLSDTSIAKSDNAIWLNYIKDEVKQMTELTNELLQLSSNDEVSMENLSLSELVRNRTLTFETLMYEQGITLNHDIDEGIYIEGNKKLMIQLINILLDNSMKYTSDNLVEIILKKDGRRNILTVNNKVSNSKEIEVDSLFERFYRSDKSRGYEENKKSYGLGLAIAKNICNKHNAKISASLKEDKISFIVTY